MAVYYITNLRKGASFFDDSGRINGYIKAINYWKSDIKFTLIGTGLSQSNYPHTFPHNIIIQTILTTGIFGTLVIFYEIIFLFKKCKYSSVRYMIYTVFIGAMFTTDFYANLFLISYFIIALVDSKKEEEQLYEETTSVNNCTNV